MTDANPEPAPTIDDLGVLQLLQARQALRSLPAGAAHDLHVQHAGQLEIVHVDAEALDQPRVFHAPDRLADQLG